MKDDPTPPPIDLVPSLRDLVASSGLNPGRLTVPFEADGRKHARIPDKHLVPATGGEKLIAWSVPSLRELFRGNRMLPPEMDQYPLEYAPHFFFIENHVLTLCDALGDQTDQELEEIYSALRRRPDGRSLGVMHDGLWQITALLLGKHVLSEAEFEALIGALARSTRKWGVRPVSRNYLAYLRETFGDAHFSQPLGV